jgi:uncharacterized membrane protein HdeD (DUF308 family)
MPDGDTYGISRRGRKFSFIPAGILIGLGVGLLVGEPGAGVLIGLGAGFIASGALQPAEETGGTGMARIRWGFVLAGIILILLGIGIVYYPAYVWPYLGAIFLILLGVWFLLRSAVRT